MLRIYMCQDKTGTFTGGALNSFKNSTSSTGCRIVTPLVIPGVIKSDGFILSIDIGQVWNLPLRGDIDDIIL